MSSIRTPLARVRGTGSAREGVSHFIGQRASAATMLLLTPWFLAGILHALSSDHAAAAEWLSSPLNSILTILALGAGLYHMRLGIQIVVEDYIARPLTRHILLLLNALVSSALFLAAVFGVVRL